MSGLCLSLGLSQSAAPSSDIAPPPLPQLLELADGTVEIVTGPGLLTLTISGGTAYDGIYVIDPDALEAGPINLVAPAISGLAEPDGTLSVFPGLWVYNAPLGTPVISRQWLADGLPIPGATATGYTVAADDAGRVIGLRETALQGTVTAAAEAEGVAIPGVPVFLLIGQSNMLGRAAYDSLGGWPAGTGEWTSGGLIDRSGTTAPLGAAEAGSMGMALEFASRWIGAKGGEIIFIQTALGGTGFVDNRWNPGNDLYQNAVTLANACLAADPARRLAGIFFIQGGADSQSQAGADGYHDALFAMATGLRSAITGAAGVPLILSGTTTTNNPAYKWAGQVDSAQELLPQRMDRVAYVNTDGLTFIETPPLHWDAPSLRVVGGIFFDRLSAGVNAVANAGGGTPAVTAAAHQFTAVTSTSTAFTTAVTAAAGQDVYVVLAARGCGEITGVTLGGQPATEVYGQVDYNAALVANQSDGLFIYKVTAQTAMASPVVSVAHTLTGLRMGCATFVVSGAAVDRVKAETDFAVNNTLVTVTETFTTTKAALVIAAGMFSSGTLGWDSETLANVVASTGIDPGNLTNNWTVGYQSFGPGASVSAAARANCGSSAANFGSLFAALLIE